MVIPPGADVKSLVFPELVYPEIFVSKTENLKGGKKDNNNKNKKAGGKSWGSPLQKHYMKILN